ncbi:MAG: protein-glutamate O-methyltransferase CheR [Gammaproteobacteria bacterium]
MARPLASANPAGTTVAPHPEKQREFAFTNREFEQLRALARAHTGISLSDMKRELIYGRVARRLRQLGLGSFQQYCEVLEQDTGPELEQFVNAITTNLTSFFREKHHFDYLAQTLLPKLAAKNGTPLRLRIWSAGCSTGEEPYSIAMTLNDTMTRNGVLDFKILATDIDSNVLARAQSGVYKIEQIQGIAEARRRRWFRRGKGDKQGLVKVMPELQAHIHFRQLNLMQPWPMHGLFDIIFCRNVVIYFDKPTQKQLFERFANVQPDSGHLFLGHSESLFKVTDRYQLIGKTIYAKVPR